MMVWKATRVPAISTGLISRTMPIYVVAITVYWRDERVVAGTDALEKPAENEEPVFARKAEEEREGGEKSQHEDHVPPSDCELHHRFFFRCTK